MNIIVDNVVNMQQIILLHEVCCSILLRTSPLRDITLFKIHDRITKMVVLECTSES